MNNDDVSALSAPQLSAAASALVSAGQNVPKSPRESLSHPPARLRLAEEGEEQVYCACGHDNSRVRNKKTVFFSTYAKMVLAQCL